MCVVCVQGLCVCVCAHVYVCDLTCQLARLRLLPTAQAMKAALDTGNEQMTEESPVQPWNAPGPAVVMWGSVMEVSAVQSRKA